MRTSLLALALVASSFGCSSSTQTRTVTGQLRSTSSTATVTAQSMDHQQFQSSVSAGRFTLELPTGASYALDIGRSHIMWPTPTGAARWARLGSGATLDLGHVSKQSDGNYSCDHQGSDDDHCDRDDADDGGDDDHGDDDGDSGGSYGGTHHGCDGGAQSGGGGGGGGAGAGGAGGGGGVSTGGGGIP